MNIVVCDDEIVFAERLCKKLKSEFAVHNLSPKFTVVDTGEKLLRFCARNKTDAVFLDIVMPGFDGFETAKQLRDMQKNIMLVFVSSKENMVYNSYEYSPIWFIPKNEMTLLEKAVNKIAEKVKISERNPYGVCLIIGNKVVEINTVGIKYFKSDGHYINYYTTDGKKSKSYRCRMCDIEAQLKGLLFVKTHNRYLVNLQNAVSVDNNFLIMRSGEQIPISRDHLANVQTEILRYYRRRRTEGFGVPLNEK